MENENKTKTLEELAKKGIMRIPDNPIAGDYKISYNPDKNVLELYAVDEQGNPKNELGYSCLFKSGCYEVSGSGDNFMILDTITHSHSYDPEDFKFKITSVWKNQAACSSSYEGYFKPSLEKFIENFAKLMDNIYVYRSRHYDVDLDLNMPPISLPELE